MNERVTLVVGAGAVENAWKPVIKAIRDVANRDVNINNANCFFAQLIYLARFYSNINHFEAAKNLVVTLDNIKILKNQICSNLKLAQENGEIRSRSELKKILSKFITSKGNKATLISTNWDTVIEDEINKIYHLNDEKKISCLHVHGDIDSDIYLPTEITPETYRTEEEEKNFGSKTSLLIKALEKTDTLLIYGLSLNPLDAELLQVISYINNVKKIIVIDPKHDDVINNLRAIIEHSHELNIIGYCPSKF
jgi:hypothetical protein